LRPRPSPTLADPRHGLISTVNPAILIHAFLAISRLRIPLPPSRRLLRDMVVLTPRPTLDFLIFFLLACATPTAAHRRRPFNARVGAPLFLQRYLKQFLISLNSLQRHSTQPRNARRGMTGTFHQLNFRHPYSVFGMSKYSSTSLQVRGMQMALDIKNFSCFSLALSHPEHSHLSPIKAQVSAFLLFSFLSSLCLYVCLFLRSFVRSFLLP
jgi:hypothetical protein